MVAVTRNKKTWSSICSCCSGRVIVVSLTVLLYLVAVIVSLFLKNSLAESGTSKISTLSSLLEESTPNAFAEQAGAVSILHTPEHIANGNIQDYISLPVLDDNVTWHDIDARVQRAIAREINVPYGLMHQGYSPGHDVVMGLASYPQAMSTFRVLVGSLRKTGFDGHIILGVHPQIPQDEQEYLKKMDVTFYAVEFADCDESLMAGTDQGNFVRAKCSKGIEYLTLEKGRFEMKRQWLHACKECTGWVLAMDTRDAFFQAPPFSGMPPPDDSPYDLLFIEEVAPYSQPNKPNKRDTIPILSNSFYQGSDAGCYGHDFHKKYGDRAVLCSGTIIGNRKGMDRFLAVFVDEFLENNSKSLEICRSSETPDQLILQPMYYSGRFGDYERTRTSPWGTGPVNTIGIPCVDNRDRSAPVYGALDLTEFDSETGLILNLNLNDGHPARISPIVHQFDRCTAWIKPFFEKYDEKLFGGVNTPLDEVKPVPWLEERQNEN